MPRGRPKKINNLETEEVEIAERAARQPLKKSVTHIERYTEPVEPEQLEILPEVREQQFEEGKHPFDVVLNDFNSRSEGGYIKVYKLPEYAKNGKASPRNVIREFCANIPVTPDYEQVIKETWGGGHYQLELREEDGGFAGARQITIAFPVLPQMRPMGFNGGISQNPTAVNSAQMQPIVMEPPDPGKELDAMLDRMGKIRRVFGDGAMGQVQQAQPPPSPPLTTESALLHLVSQDSEVIDQFTGSLKRLLKRGDNGAHETTWLDLVDSAIKADLIPKTLDRAKALLLEVIGAKNGTQTVGQEAHAPIGQVSNQGGRQDLHNPSGSVQTIPQGTQSNQAIGSTTSGDQRQTDGNNQEAVIARTLQTLLSACEAYPLHLQNCDDQNCKQLDHFGGPAGWIMNEERAYPFLGELINLVIQLPVDQVTIWISSQPGLQHYTALPHWNAWITGLQKLLKDSTEMEEETEGDQPNV